MDNRLIFAARFRFMTMARWHFLLHRTGIGFAKEGDILNTSFAQVNANHETAA